MAGASAAHRSCVRATWTESATRGRFERARNIAGENDPVPPQRAIRARGHSEQRLRVRMVGLGVERALAGEFDDAAVLLS
jgi:hypothetical protein